MDVGRQDHRLAFITAIDDFVEQIGGLVIEGQIPDLIDAQQSNIGVAAQFAAAAFRRLPVQFFQQRRRGTKQHGMPGEHGGVSDVLSDHRLAQTVAAHQDEIAGFAQKIQRQRAFDDVAFDLGGPGPIEVGHGLESLDAADPQPPLQAAARAFGGFCLGEFFEDLMSGAAGLGDTRDEVIQLRGHGAQADLLELSGKIIVRHRCRCLECGRVHRRSPDREGGCRATELADGG